MNKMVNDCRNDGFTGTEWMIGAMGVATLIAVCLLAEIINVI